jgi:NAD(P)-dependent dehydrogenase (short-subunit alcohol dehydrogenase family)
MSNTLSRMPLRRWGVPDDLGPARRLLADPANLAHTGDTLVVDGAYWNF